MKKPILLSPAGNYECFRGALLAGADAVYMGGDRFSARAYADNFTCENVCSAVTEAHFYGKRVYLTLNTLMKDSELSDAIEYIRPMYEAGLDAVIVQDLGAMAEIKKTYPDLEIHASTQMTISGEEGALWLKDKGIDCVVPSRELSIGEIKRMKEKTGMKLECFIHGAMCYCYSGQCLMSSMLGDRSGNRGRCAQPCRQMYETLIDGVDPERLRTTSYPLSMRDMCTIEILPELIEAGIDIFKIEGRMKSPEYCAGVTSIYRKYIDRYFENGSDGYFVDNEDMNILRHLYVRNQLQDGYYNRPNGADMISGDKPGYSGSDEKMIESIHKKYLEDQEKTVLSAKVTLKTGSPAELIISDKDISGKASCGCVQKAQKAPITEESFKERISKTGGTVVEIPIDNIRIDADEDIFMPNGAINELRRNAISDYVNNKIRSYGIYRETVKDNDDETVTIPGCIKENDIKDLKEKELNVQNIKVIDLKVKDDRRSKLRNDLKISISVMSVEQFDAAVRSSCENVIIDSSLFRSYYDHVSELMDDKSIPSHGYYVVLPYIFRSSRNNDRNFMNDIISLMSGNSHMCGCVFRNADELHYLECSELMSGNKIRLIADAGFYTFNSSAAESIADEISGLTYPYELTGREIGNLKHESIPGELIVYSSIPMMVTANCIRKTAGHCLHGHTGEGNEIMLDSKTGIRDRKGIKFQVYTNCEHCYNVIYNSVPLNLSGHTDEIRATGASSIRLEFVYENGSEVTRIISAFDETLKTGKLPSGYKLRPNAYTTGHFIHGIL